MNPSKTKEEKQQAYLTACLDLLHTVNDQQTEINKLRNSHNSAVETFTEKFNVVGEMFDCVIEDIDTIVDTTDTAIDTVESVINSHTRRIQRLERNVGIPQPNPSLQAVGIIGGISALLIAGIVTACSIGRSKSA